jgi:Major intrinsic protein
MVALSRCVQCLTLGVIVLAKSQPCESFSLPRESLRRLVDFNPSGRRDGSEAVLRLQSSPDKVNPPEIGDSSVRGGAVQANDKFWTAKLVRQLLAEAVGTFIIVQMGTASVMAAVFDNALVGLFQIASVWIIAITLAIATTGPISGAHLNPAISISFSILRPSSAFGAGRLLLYIISQFVGASMGSLVNLLMYRQKILQFEATHNIIRGTAGSIASAKAFGEYFL